MKPEIEPAILAFIRSLPPGTVRIEDANIRETEDTVIFQKPPAGPTRQALVRVETMAGENGYIDVSASAYDDVLEFSGRVGKTYKPFPPPGVIPVGRGALEEFRRKRRDRLDLLLIMEPMAAFRIFRTGDLRDRVPVSPNIFVQWDGSTLHARVPNRYSDRPSAPSSGVALA